MGGNAFATAGPNGSSLHVPRMPPAVYQERKEHFNAILHVYYAQVAVPTEVPEKPDHGDIDFLVARPIVDSPLLLEFVQERLGAAFYVPRGDSHSFAVPYPDRPESYVQVDVEVIRHLDTDPYDGSDLFTWEFFMKSYSDLLQIVGITHRSLGLACNNRGFHYCIGEIAPRSKKKSLLFLTRDPKRAMQFYGFDVEKYYAGFANKEELYQWVCNGRFFSRENFEQRTEKSNDRQRLRKRSMYREFVELYLPAHPEVGGPVPCSRMAILGQAMTAFGKWEEYKTMMHEHLIYEQDRVLWQRIKEALPLEGKPLMNVLKALRKWVRFEDGRPSISQDRLQPDGTSEAIVWPDAVENGDQILAWILQNWQEVQALEKDYARSRADSATA